MTLSNLLEWWLCEYVNLVLLWISRVLEQDYNAEQYFLRKNIE